MRATFTKFMKQELELNSKSCLLLGDIGVHSFEKEILKYPERVFNVGILEQSMISIASGLSLGGLSPTVHTISPFLILRALEQIKIDFGYQELGGNLVSVGASIDYSALGSTHHCPEDIKILSTIPNIELMVPGNALELELLLKKTISNSKLTYTRLSELENKSYTNLEFKKITKIKHGETATVLAVGPMLDYTLEACSQLDVTILYCNVVKPIDLQTLTSNIVNSSLIIIEPFSTNSTANLLMDTDFLFKCHIKKSIGFPLKFFNQYGTIQENIEQLKLDSNGIKSQINRILFHEHN